MIDRIVHHADVIPLKGASYRLRDRHRHAAQQQSRARIFTLKPFTLRPPK
jgi:hypothetical protein